MTSRAQETHEGSEGEMKLLIKRDSVAAPARRVINENYVDSAVSIIFAMTSLERGGNLIKRKQLLYCHPTALNAL